MIDTHCHLLPGLDDGPATITEAIQLARMMLADGVSGALCTPTTPGSSKRATPTRLRSEGSPR